MVALLLSVLRACSLRPDATCAMAGVGVVAGAALTSGRLKGPLGEMLPGASVGNEQRGRV
jgi:hypothetical protein